MSQISGVLDYCIKGLIEYETQKVVQIHSKKIGITFRLIQLGIIMYVILWVMVYEKGYQSFDQAVSGVTAKLKGVAFANVTNNPEIGARVWDAGDYVIPPQQNSAFFVMTNVVYTSGQMLGVCEEAHDVLGNSCYNDSQCQAGHLVLRGSGIQTGRCVNSTRQANLSVCEIYGWCPTEHDIIPRPHLLGSAENFTVMIKNNIEFPRFRVKRRNILSWMSRLFLKTCLYNPNDKILKYCPIFRLGDILKYSGSVNKDIWETGEYCLPKYVFRRLDDFQSEVAKGWNFRLSQHYLDGGIRKRNLIKAYGIQFFITVYGTGGKFDILTFSMNLGSGLALLGIATVLCDMIILNTTRNRGVYRKAKVDLIAAKRHVEQVKEINKGRNNHIIKDSSKNSSTNHNVPEMNTYKEDNFNTNKSMMNELVSQKIWLDDKRCKKVSLSNKISKNYLKNEQLFFDSPSFLGFQFTPISSSLKITHNKDEIMYEKNFNDTTVKCTCTMNNNSTETSNDISSLFHQLNLIKRYLIH
ncbi:unnamed protein product [Heterobilharzia americana]|nr:unnamed protein product [Heterobilharzia americana]